MKECPVCSIPMDEVNKSGVLIDICPSCKGVWLDRGELGKLMENARRYHEDYTDYNHSPHRDTFRDHENYHGKHYSKHKGYHKKKGLLKMLEDVFD